MNQDIIRIAVADWRRGTIAQMGVSRPREGRCRSLTGQNAAKQVCLGIERVARDIRGRLLPGGDQARDIDIDIGPAGR